MGGKKYLKNQDKIQDKNILARSFEAWDGVLYYDPSLDDVEEKLIDLFMKLGYLPKS